jgi:hypothetical protein
MSASSNLSDSERMLTCERCGTAFGCTLDAKSCWCADESYRMPMPAQEPGKGSDCLCPDCLRAAAANLKAPRPA